MLHLCDLAKIGEFDRAFVSWGRGELSAALCSGPGSKERRRWMPRGPATLGAQRRHVRYPWACGPPVRGEARGAQEEGVVSESEIPESLSVHDQMPNSKEQTELR